jgi:hypothetical protein
LKKHSKKKTSDGGSTYNAMVKLRNGRRFDSAVASESLSGYLLLWDAQHSIDTMSDKLKEFSKKKLGFFSTALFR